MVLVAYSSLEGRRAALCGPVGQPPGVYQDLDLSHAEQLAHVALDEPDHHAATRFLRHALVGLDSPVPGLRNAGLLATQTLISGVREMAEWSAAVSRSSPLLGDRGRYLVEKLGFTITQAGAATSVLTVGDADRAIAVFCEDKEPFDAPSKRLGGASPVDKALALADRKEVTWVILTRASEIRLYSARRDTGVGRRGRAETFVELNLALLPPREAGFLHLIFSADALDRGGTLAGILAQSERYAADLATRLRERVYFETVPSLAKAIARRMSRSPAPEELDEAYQQVMLILFRLLFVAYAEAKDLLPYSTNTHYRDHSLTLLVSRLREDHLAEGEVAYDPAATSLWRDVGDLWQAVDRGNLRWGVPAYNGGLFSDDPAISRAGAAVAELSIPDADFAPVLATLLLDRTPDDTVGPVDFRALSVTEFGTIYEGLLESSLAVAQDDLAIHKAKGQDTYVPAGPEDEAAVEAGTVYLHNRSGVRKATGSYFTKPFAVEHLLDAALEAALDNHIERLERLWASDSPRQLEQAFFDFRCADIAMGSGHFLVAALDRIEARLSDWLAEHPLGRVTDELSRLRRTALEALGDSGAVTEIKESTLIRRQVARHCVYGVDRNPIAVELARLAIWVHTFVPGLPLSFLDHNLVCGDSLTGVGTLDEVVAEFEPDSDPAAPSLFRNQLESLLERSKDALTRLARTSDATKREIDEARAAHLEAQEAVKPATALFDVLAAHRSGVCQLPENYSEETVITISRRPEVLAQIEWLGPVHFPSAFPDVFLRSRPGFDCVVGNPPWEKVVVDREVWWGMHLPGVRSLPVAKRRAQIDALEADRPDLAARYTSEKDRAEALKRILRATFPKLGSGQTDLYKAFSWANLALCRDGGKVGMVLPRSAVSDAGMTKWRTEVVSASIDPESAPGGGGESRMSVATLINHKGWVFEGVHNSYTVALVVVTRYSRSSPASMPSSGPSTVSTADTRSRWSPPARPTAEPNLGGGFDGEHDEPHVAIYPGPARSLAHFREIVEGGPELIPLSEFARWSNTAAFPQVPTRAAFRVWRKIKGHPRFDGSDLADSARRYLSLSLSLSELEAPPSSRRLQLDHGPAPVSQRRWRFRPVAELHATHDRRRFMNDDGTSAQSASSTPPVTGVDS